LTEKITGGRQLALRALTGQRVDRVPVGPLTWGFDYYWRVAELAPWQLACGGSETWHRAHMALLERHQPDVLWYSGAGDGPREPTLLAETPHHWLVRDNNTGTVYRLIKESLALQEEATGVKACDPLGDIRTTADADRLIPEFTGWGDVYLAGLRRLIGEVGDRALVLPHHSPGYICACYALGFERAMETMIIDPGLLLHVADRYAAGDELRMAELAAAGAEAVYIADGWASCDIISPRMFRQFALPYQRSMTEAAHRAGLRVILWNEGDVLPLLELEASLPVDAFAIEQPRKGIDLNIARVREVFGPERCLFGNLDSERLLAENDPRAIAHAVEDQLRQSGPGNPFVLTTGSPLPSNIDPAAVDAFIAAARSLS
jgi:uroporphyrinogen-III decarboxylase